MTITTTIRTEPTTATEPSSGLTMFVLKQLRCAELRAELYVNQIRAASIALSAGMITPEVALLILHETGVGLGDE